MSVFAIVVLADLALLGFIRLLLCFYLHDPYEDDWLQVPNRHLFVIPGGQRVASATILVLLQLMEENDAQQLTLWVTHDMQLEGQSYTPVVI